MKYIQTPYDIKAALRQTYENDYNGEKSRGDTMAIYRGIADKNAKDADDSDCSYLHFAAQYADYEALEYLISEGVRASVKNRYGETALHTLAREGKRNYRFSKLSADPDEAIKKCVAILLKAGTSALVRDTGAGGNLCYHVASSSDNFAFINAMIDNEVKLDMPDSNGHNLLYRLVDNASSSQANINSPWEDRQREGIMDYDTCLALIKRLIDYGLDSDAKGQNGNTAVDYAVQEGLKEIALLYKGEYDPSDDTFEDKIAAGGMDLHLAAQKNDVAAILALLRLGAEPNEFKNSDSAAYGGSYEDATPLSVACMCLNTEAVRALLENGADPNIRGGVKGRSAFWHLAYRSAHRTDSDTTAKEIMRLLLIHGLDPNGIVDEKGHTPLNFVCSDYSHTSSHHYEALRGELLEMGLCDCNMPDDEGVTPLMNLASSRDKGADNDLIILLEAGADLSLRDTQGNTALMYAARNLSNSNAIMAADLMFSFGDPGAEVVNNEGKTAMDLAIENGNEELVKFILGKM